MQYEIYRDIHIRSECSIFEFFSIGRKGIILKRIAFTPTEYHNIYSLLFGDLNIDGRIIDSIVNNNGDRNKVLATVAFAIDLYLKQYPERTVFFTGSTEERTRLYRMAIGHNFEELSTKYEILCQTDNGIIPFKRNIKTSGFLITKKA